MLALIVALVGFSASGALAATITAPWVDFRAHINPALGGLDSYNYKPWPRTANEANDLKYVSPPEENHDACDVSDVPFITLCPFSDPSVCLLYDNNGYIAGIEFGVVKYNSNKDYPFGKKPYFVSKRRFGLDCWILTTYLVDQNTLNAGGRTALTVTGTNVTMQNGRGSVLAIPRYESEMAGTLWKKQSCQGGRGQIYQYNMTTAMTCDKLFPLVVYYKVGELHGFGFQAFGANTPTGKSYWMDPVTTTHMKTWYPTYPACLPTWADKSGIISLHVFFTINPWYISC